MYCYLYGEHQTHVLRAPNAALTKNTCWIPWGSVLLLYRPLSVVEAYSYELRRREIMQGSVNASLLLYSYLSQTALLSS